jgi:DNA-binding GntR family transcriptional regulator
MLDQIRRDIQSRLDELLGEVDKLRHALAALTSRDGTDTSAAAKASAAAAKASADKSAASSTGAEASKPATRQRAASRSAGTSSRKPAAAPAAPVRTAPGATKAAVIGALAGGEPMTAGEIATATGLGRATISTTLSKLAKTGEVTKADRGYLVPKSDASPSADGAGSEEAVTAGE